MRGLLELLGFLFMARLKINKNYGVIPNNVLNNKLLSFKAKGIYAYIQSKPDGWEFSAERIALQSEEGLASVRTGLKELELEGYLIRKKYHNEKGFFEIEYILFEEPMLENPIVENPTLDNPMSENYTNNSNKEFSKKDINNNNHNSKKDNRKEFIESEFFINLFDSLWFSYGRKGSKKKALQEVYKLNENDLKAFCESIEHIKAYVDSTNNDPKFRKDFERYISNKYWESDIFISEKKGKISRTMELYSNLINKDF